MDISYKKGDQVKVTEQVMGNIMFSGMIGTIVHDYNSSWHGTSSFPIVVDFGGQSSIQYPHHKINQMKVSPKEIEKVS